jgi:hypothetical protein
MPSPGRLSRLRRSRTNYTSARSRNIFTYWSTSESLMSDCQESVWRIEGIVSFMMDNAASTVVGCNMILELTMRFPLVTNLTASF